MEALKLKGPAREQGLSCFSQNTIDTVSMADRFDETHASYIGTLARRARRAGAQAVEA